MPATRAPGQNSGTLPLPVGTAIGLIIAILAVVVVAVFSYRSLQARSEATELLTHTLQVIEKLEVIGSTLKDAETGQRGYLLTGEPSHHDLYQRARAALPVLLGDVGALVSDNPEQAARIPTLRSLVEERLDVAGRTVDLQQQGDAAGALALLRGGRGIAAMESIRSLIAEMTATERALLATRETTWASTEQRSRTVTVLGSGVLLMLIVLSAVMMSRDYLAREATVWIRTGQMELAARIQGEQRLETLAERVITFLAGYMDAHAGAVYLAESDGTFRRLAGYALSEGGAPIIESGQGLVGQAARDNRTMRVSGVPEGYLTVSSALGRRTPIELLIAPAAADGVVFGVIELGFFRKVRDAERELMERVSELMGVAVRSSKDRTRLEELLAETQQQSEELQAQQEELRVNNEELEEQSRVLQESQARLENQQAELEQINSHLEEQTEVLEAQKTDLTQAQATLTAKAAELERANQYKSEFLANMSHELRTPLNSSLILATLLADNNSGNLTDEQVQFAKTIYEAGTDLLALINDILDLSKIESGKVELSIAPVNLAAAIDSLIKTVAPLAEQKQLELSASVDAAVPPAFSTDAQRLGQVLKNLMSNAIKFTDRGSVTLHVSRDGDRLRFAVRDTGIGIPASQQSIIFEAFRQADGSTHRKYGGTGLGLSIARDLSRLLGGDITVESEPGRGSVFTLLLPLSVPVSVPMPAAAPVAASPAAPQTRPMPAARSALGRPQIDDDRDRLTQGSRRILIVEDDVAFAGILRDLVREKGFQAVVTHSANDGLAAAAQFAPSAILLDINLPDHSGLGVLDQLKRNPRTRHIPVHVASGTDFSQQALERGAIGYALKPVQREEILDAIRRLESKLTQGVKRVLVVEDDARQRESVRQLLSSAGVEITGAATAAEARQHLASTTFDCVVMDLKLPDVSGFDLLEQMAAQDQVSFPPVIVYTGRSLTADEEQRLRRFSKSIIIKDARSPERLLDEVTLFLHQVEAELPPQQQQMLRAVRDRDTTLEDRRILVVEDDARNIFALSRVLEPRGATVAIARNGREALEQLSKDNGAIDLVLMDIMMPEMDGITAITEIRKRPEWRRLPIIALTAKAMADDQERCLAAGANDYMAKPFDVDKLLSLIRVWMPK